MRIDIRAIGFDMTDAIHRHVEARVRAALAPFARRVRQVTVRVDDVNADRGGADKRCGCVAALRGRGVVVAEATHEDLYAAARQAADRLHRAALRHLTRHVAREREDRRRPGALIAPP
jgi:ribosomal subunit interface protein